LEIQQLKMSTVITINRSTYTQVLTLLCKLVNLRVRVSAVTSLSKSFGKRLWRLRSQKLLLPEAPKIPNKFLATCADGLKTKSTP
jgi:hypothetical protein